MSTTVHFVGGDKVQVDLEPAEVMQKLLSSDIAELPTWPRGPIYVTSSTVTFVEQGPGKLQAEEKLHDEDA
jgi:hypothetical protein